MDAVVAFPNERWNVDHFACMSFLLARTDDAVAELKAQERDRLAHLVSQRLRYELGRNPQALERPGVNIFNYGPGLIGGLLRWRMHEPFALIAGNGPPADDMLNAVEKMRDYIEPRLDGSLVRRQGLYKNLGELAGLLRGDRGGGGNLLGEILGGD